MEIGPWAWAALAGLVVALLLVDMLAFGRRGEEISFRRAVAWSVGWTALGLSFGALLWAWQGRGAAEQYLAGFLIEKSLSIDNLFVFALIFATFSIPAVHQRRAIFWGIVGAIVLRALFILAGAGLLDAFHLTIYVFGGFLVVTGLRMARRHETEFDPARSRALRALRRVLPLTDRLDGDALSVRIGGRRLGTPLLAALLMIASFDVVFAVDSIPAIFAVTRETFVVYAANAFSLLGLAALYFVLAGMLGRFRYLNLGLAAVLVFVGAKMALSEVVHVPVYVSLAVIVAALGLAVGASLVGERDERPVSAPAAADVGSRP